MSMNLFAYFEDEKGKIVNKINLHQSSTETTFKVMDGKTRIEVTPSNFLDVMKFYFLETLQIQENEFGEKDIEEYQKKFEEEKENYFKEIAEDYDITIEEAKEKWMPSIYKYENIPVILFGKILEEWQKDHYEYLTNQLNIFCPDYKCYLEIS